MDEVIHQPEERHTDVHHEETDISIALVVKVVVISLVLAVVIHVGLYYLMIAFDVLTRKQADLPATDMSIKKGLPPVPRLQVLGTAPVIEMDEFRTRESAILEQYGSSPATPGAVRIPIEQAMRLAVRRGFPSRPVMGSNPQVLGTASGRSVPGVIAPANEMPIGFPTQVMYQTNASNVARPPTPEQQRTGHESP
ncbi:MAG: hypothetical protein ABI718_02900 [Acidobacteriota bacterium]